MRSKNVFMALALIVVSFGVASAQDFLPAVFVNMSEVTGAGADGRIEPSSLPATLVIPIHLKNIAVERTAISNGFIFKGSATFENIGGAWNPAYPWDWVLAFGVGCSPPACYPYFDQILAINYFTATLAQTPVTTDAAGIGFAGLTGAFGTGLPPTFDDFGYTVTLTGVNGVVGNTLTMDSSFWKPANYWVWTGVGENVFWGGPYVFEIGSSDVSIVEGAGVPSSFSLNQNYPNPFNPTTTVAFDVPHRASVKVVVYNILGQPVRTLVDKELAAGKYTADWDGTTDAGRQVASGVYLCSMLAGDYTGKIKMLMVK